ncbi:MAG: response regulator [Desulfovibrionales bacterium]
MIKKILLVDDDKSLQSTFKKGLETYSENLQVVLAGDGQEAKDKLKSQDIFLVITDLKMPRVDGFSLLTHVMEHYPEIPVIVITGYGTPQMKKLARKGGAVGYIEKPFMIEDLAHAALSQLRKISEGGTLHHVSSGMFLQLIEMEEKTCTIRVEDKEGGLFGVLYFRDGRLLDAKVGEVRAEEAAYAIFSWDDVSISIQNSCSLTDGPVHQDVQSILMEAMRRKDEADSGPAPGQSAEEDFAPAEEIEVEPVEDDPFPAPEEGIVQEEDSELAIEDVSEEEDIPTVDYIRIKLSADLGNKSGIKDVYVDTQWNDLIKRFKGLGNLFQAGDLKLCYLDRGVEDDLVLLPGDENITISFKSKFPRDKIIQVLSK